MTEIPSCVHCHRPLLDWLQVVIVGDMMVHIECLQTVTKEILEAIAKPLELPSESPGEPRAHGERAN
jgi:hypothetical protein